MPTYQYVCTHPEGKHEFEVVQSFSDAAVSTCPECGTPVRKVYGSVGVVFKGSGFYRTDSRKAESAATATDSSTAKESSKESSKESTKESAKESAKSESSSTSSTSRTASSSASTSSSGNGSGSGKAAKD